MIGIFDSGLGGLTVWRTIREALPKADLVYLADQKHVPYGERTVDELQQLLRVNLDFFEHGGADLIVAGCNTSCAIGRRYGWPATVAPILDVIASGATAAAASGAHRIGVVATSATVRLGAYGDAIRTLVADAAVEEVAAPALVPLIEGGRLSGPEMRAAIVAAVEGFSVPPQAIVYGCTHYPLADDAFAEVLGPSVVRIDPAREQARAAIAWFGANGPPSNGRSIFRTTGDAMLFREQIVALAGPYRDVEGVNVSGLEPVARPAAG